MTRLISILRILPYIHFFFGFSSFSWHNADESSDTYRRGHGDPFGTRQSIKLASYLRWSSNAARGFTYLRPLNNNEQNNKCLDCHAHKQRRWLITRTHSASFEWVDKKSSEPNSDRVKLTIINLFLYIFSDGEIKILKQHDVPLLLRYRRSLFFRFLSFRVR